MSVLSDDLRTLSYEAALYFYPLVFIDITAGIIASMPGFGHLLGAELLAAANGGTPQ